MGKNFNKDNRNRGNIAKNATSVSIKRNVSKKVADQHKKAKEYTKSVQRNEKVEAKKQEWELRK